MGCEELVSNQQNMWEAGFRDGDEVMYLYTGDFREAKEGREPTWVGRLGNGIPAEKKKAAPPKSGSPALENNSNKRSGLAEHFQALGLSEATPSENIKRHYRKLALETHPDKHPEDVEGATQRFRLVKAAYEAIRERLRI
mmetsp:Transcript_53221/g.108985  ORF Transcript_53221/g.108985 Transcript_53221/m.108985 type:complete len:140 (+) Transcript_53221:146-565(+)